MVKKLSSVKVLDQTIKIEYKKMENWENAILTTKP